MSKGAEPNGEVADTVVKILSRLIVHHTKQLVRDPPPLSSLTSR